MQHPPTVCHGVFTVCRSLFSMYFDSHHAAELLAMYEIGQVLPFLQKLPIRL